MLGKKIPLFSKLRTENKPFSIAHAPILTKTVHLQSKHLYLHDWGTPLILDGCGRRRGHSRTAYTLCATIITYLLKDIP